MKKNTIKLSVLTLLLATNVALAQEEQQKKVEQLDEVVLSDTKFELKKENSGKIIYKITQKDIAQSAGKTVVDLLDNIAGIEINGNNNAEGSNISTYIRGGRNHQVAIVIDGVLMTDPTEIGASFNLNLLDINQIESIEILKGASSTLYGSSAANGVINIKLKKASKSPIVFNYSGSIGTSDTQRNRDKKLDAHNHSIGARGTLNKFTYLANYSFSKTDGISAANDKDALDSFETDNFSSNNALLKIGFNATDNLSFELFGNYNQYDYDYDSGAYSDSDVNIGEQEQIQIGLKSNFKYSKGNLVATFSKSNLEREFDSFNSWTSALENYTYEGKSTFLEVINKYNFTKQIHLIAGINYQKYDNQTNTPYSAIERDLANYNTFDPFVSAVFTGNNGFNLNIGARLNNHSEYGNHFVYHANPSYNIVNTEAYKLKVISSYSTAFIAPSTYQLFSDYGNVALTPEENKTFEFGFETSANKWLQASAVFFYRDEDNKIIFVTDPVTYDSFYENTGISQNVKGIETNIVLTSLDSKIKFNIAHTYTYKSTDLDYIPKNKLVLGLDVSPFKNTNVAINYKQVGKRTYFDQWGSFGTAEENVVIGAYNLLDISANYSWNYFTVFAALNNVSNKEYEDVLGYSTKGRNLKLGIRVNF